MSLLLKPSNIFQNAQIPQDLFYKIKYGISLHYKIYTFV